MSIDNPFDPDFKAVYGKCSKCGGNLATCAANGCPNDIKPLSEIDQLRTKIFHLSNKLDLKNDHIKEQVTALQTRLATAEQRLAVAIKLITKIFEEDETGNLINWGGDKGRAYPIVSLIRMAQAFLSNADSEWVGVKRDDLEILDLYLDRQVAAGRVGSRTGSAHNHIKAVLNPKGGRDGE